MCECTEKKKLNMCVYIGSTAGFLFAADKAVSKYEMDVLGYTDEDMLRELRSNRVPDEHLSTFDRSLRYLNDNRWSFIGKILYIYKKEKECVLVMGLTLWFKVCLGLLLWLVHSVIVSPTNIFQHNKR